MKAPEKAVILAAGYGTRMLPLSRCTPKPIMPLWGKPVLGHALDTLCRWGVKDVLINLHHCPDRILRYAAEARPACMKLNFSFEPEIMGTGGALRKARWFLRESAPFWMINGDVVFDVNPRALLDVFSDGRRLSVLLLNDSEGPRTVEMTKGIISSFQSRRPGAEETYTFCGVQLLSPSILRFIPEQGFSSIIDAYIRSMSRGYQIAGVCPDRTFWADIGTPESYLGAHRSVHDRFRTKQPGGRLFDPAQENHTKSLRRKGVFISGFLSAGGQARIERGARISDSVVWNDAFIASNAILENAVVAEQARVRGLVPGIALRSSEAAGNADVAFAVEALGWDSSAVTLIHLEPRGSGRSFTRLARERDSVMLIRYGAEREENAFYVGHARFLGKMGWPVPGVILDAPRRRLSIVQDLGDSSLQRMAETMPLPRIARVYQLVMDAVRRLHREAAGKARCARLRLSPPFSADLYLWEREFFARHLLAQHMNMPEQQRKMILAELEQVARLLQEEQSVLIHRDLQSSNILVVRGKPYFIDFQGMRMGVAAYDLASLLCDPYVELPARLQRQLLLAYNEGLSKKERVAENVFWLAAIERLAQALGAYARMSARPETARFRRYIMPAARMMLLALQQAGQCPRLTAAMRCVLNGPADPAFRGAPP